ncbi:hypothetical protein GCM10008940_02550 [Microbulbifer agarilyticus]
MQCAGGVIPGKFHTVCLAFTLPRAVVRFWVTALETGIEAIDGSKARIEDGDYAFSH